MSSKLSDGRKVEASFSKGCLVVEVTEKYRGPQGLVTASTVAYIRATRRQLERALRRAFKR